MEIKSLCLGFFNKISRLNVSKITLFLRLLSPSKVSNKIRGEITTKKAKFMTDFNKRQQLNCCLLSFKEKGIEIRESFLTF